MLSACTNGFNIPRVKHLVLYNELVLNTTKRLSHWLNVHAARYFRSAIR